MIHEPETAGDPLLACLGELCRYFGRPRSAVALRAGVPLIDGRLAPEAFVRAARRADVDAERVDIALDALVPDKLPAVLLEHDGGVVLALAIEDDGRLVLWQPATRERSRATPEELAASYSGTAILAKPRLVLDERSALLAGVRDPDHWFWGTLLRYRKIYVDTALASLVTNLLAVASPLFTMNVYDRVVPNRAYETLWVLAIGVVLAFVFELLLRTLRGYFLDQAGKRADVVMSSILYERVLGLRLEHRPASAGGMASTMKEFESLRDFFTSATLVSVIDLPFVLVFVFVIWLVGGPLFWIPLLAVPVIIGTGIAFQPALNHAMNLNLAEATQKQAVLVETLGGLETLKTLSAEGHMQSRWEALVEAAAASSTKTKLLALMVVNLTSFSQQLVTVVTVVAGVYLIEQNVLTTGGLIACTILAGRVMAPLAQVSALFVRYQAARHALAGLNRLVALEQERPEARRFLHRPRLQGDIVFDKVSFAYPGQQVPALREVSFAIKAGERVAILGRIGSGKSTLLKVILGLYRPQSGAVRFDGIDQNQIDPVDLRANLGCVDQEARLFFGSLQENIAITDPTANDERIVAAAKLGGVEDFAQRHPAGYEMRVGEAGSGISGGQRQCIAIARAVLRDPSILLLDEPTSGMDQASEQNFMRAMSAFLTDRTLLLVTHKPSMMPLVDKIILMDAGRVVAVGPRDSVLRALAENERKT